MCSITYDLSLDKITSTITCEHNIYYMHCSIERMVHSKGYNKAHSSTYFFIYGLQRIIILTCFFIIFFIIIIIIIIILILFMIIIMRWPH